MLDSGGVPQRPGQPTQPACPKPPGHRERKKQRTRRALIDAATRLFAERGYDGTTIADITEAAGVAPRTFFSYFECKEDVLFTDSIARLERVLDVLASRGAGEGISELLVRVVSSFEEVQDLEVGFLSPTGQMRMQLVFTTPAVQARAAHWIFDTEERLASALYQAYPDELDEIAAAAIVGAYTGAIMQGIIASIKRGHGPSRVLAELRRSCEIALRGVANPVPPPATPQTPGGTPGKVGTHGPLSRQTQVGPENDSAEPTA
ncbi:MAG: TetR family transcriptional regulator [Dactylosporangium sp.]|nr:TetR/AcrR family transcriptional regulator [Dactylosporangium sp.]NNJ60269.1 TetR family transcriptional regulator [Dactylosporangium sp.]